MKNIENKTKAKITHIMADGTIRDSVAGMVIDPKQCPGYYELLIKMIREDIKKEKEKQYKQTNE